MKSITKFLDNLKTSMISSIKFFLVLLNLISVVFVVVQSDSDCDVPIIPAKKNGIEGQYIVVMKENATDRDSEDVIRTMETSGANIKHNYRGRVLHAFGFNRNKFHGFAIRVNDNKDSGTLEKAKKNCAVKHIEQDQQAKTTACNVQSNSGWCLAKISQQFYNYVYPSSAGYGTTVYVIDSGCNWTHPDINGRITNKVNFVSTEDYYDYNGHGTLTVSLVGGYASGVAKAAKLVCVKAMDGQGIGSYSDIIAAVNWCAHQSDYGIISMSLGGGYSPALNSALENAYNSGHLPIVAAGNSNEDAAETSPASTSKAITVASSDWFNNFASFSNYGPFVDVIAPGVRCNVADAKTNTIVQASGTSISTPLVAGIAAVIQSQYRWMNDQNSPMKITNTLLNAAMPNQISNVPGNTVNKLLYWANCN